MLSLKLTVIDKGGSNTYPVTPKVIVDFERKFGTGLTHAFADGGDQKMEHIFWLAWRATHAAGKVVKPFEEWLDDVDDIDIETDDVRPFDGAPPDG